MDPQDYKPPPLSEIERLIAEHQDKPSEWSAGATWGLTLARDAILAWLYPSPYGDDR